MQKKISGVANSYTSYCQTITVQKRVGNIDWSNIGLSKEELLESLLNDWLYLCFWHTIHVDKYG